ncbi:hypothetical protein Vretimale_17210 [Volvox reticuliferus]|uniref:Aldehyde dehydrogenase domain-containing protein n=1 Tax=Volvox reticuliferus TaxID=1737510 RepID=A0A8J4GSS3_9CHLO|nr:hypothetical protein Vretimale_17210 [Volvox reticuliferus]
MRSAVLDNVATSFEYYAGQAEALGLAGLITPWNYPLLMAPWKVVPALAARCCAVLKPSELASLTCLELAAIAAEVQLPPGVLNVVTGTGPGAGAPLSAHPGLAKAAFTGSAATGRRVSLSATVNLRPAFSGAGGQERTARAWGCRCGEGRGGEGKHAGWGPEGPG